MLMILRLCQEWRHNHACLRFTYILLRACVWRWRSLGDGICVAAWRWHRAGWAARDDGGCTAAGTDEWR